MFIQLLKSIFRLFCGTQEQYPASQGHQYPTPPSSQPPTKWNQSVHGPKDANQINQNNEYYVSLRARANEHGDKMAKCFQESHEAYARGDGAQAKELSNQGKDHQRKMVDLNKEASDFIFVENNKNLGQDSKPGEVDLHGLYVKEAIARADQAIQDATNRGQAQICFIVGKGLHSQGGVAKIKPAIEELIQKHQLCAEIDPNNSGVLIVFINSGASQRGIGADEISRRLERDGESCTIM
ncbi:hypothetical protein M413DRAFT_28588 [Hebeloma cylindrosporum]|uniref:Smr domain-containing protein n=1 Tax=Hebeloma cylindrosporum TaxID=76867 RepID=A0A0C2YG23_HEBCY|nr:hypothetical protein M413DRAFT_28588 [Hebeloma cylindrosporum h7]